MTETPTARARLTPDDPTPPWVDTIVAVSTPPGRGGIGVVRLSGPRALALAASLLRLPSSLHAPEAHARAQLAQVIDPAHPAGPALDQALVTAFHAPRSYTGEDLVEISAHGSPVVLEAIVRSALTLGSSTVELASAPVRLAEPGEFTRRAFLAGRLDLTQAEAVHDLIAAQTLAQARLAAQQLGGALSHRLQPAKHELLELIAHLEAAMDFASGELDDVDAVPSERIVDACSRLGAQLLQLTAGFERGQRLRLGASIALVGAPNVGKSSLFNRLLDRDRAIVTSLAGTTRDTLEETLALGGVPLRLVDTAGLREAADPTPSVDLDLAEQLGIQRTWQAVADADFVLLILDLTAPRPLASELDAWRSRLGDRPLLVAANKADLLPSGSPQLHPQLPPNTDLVLTSALTGQGVDQLRDLLLQRILGEAGLAEFCAAANLRQQQALLSAADALHRAQALAADHIPAEIVLLELHSALQSLDALTGATSTEDILARIFSTFCIGK